MKSVLYERSSSDFKRQKFDKDTGTDSTITSSTITSVWCDETGLLRNRPLFLPRDIQLSFCCDLLRCVPNPKSDLMTSSFRPRLLPPKMKVLEQVPHEFTDLNEYKRVWAQLLLAEAFTGLESGWCQAESKEATGQMGRTLDFHDRIDADVLGVRTTLSNGGRRLQFTSLRVPSGCEYRDGDIVLISCDLWADTALGIAFVGDPDLRDSLGPMKNTGYVELTLLTCCGVRSGTPSGCLPGEMYVDLRLGLYAVSNVVTSLRECVAIDSVSALPFASSLLRPLHRSNEDKSIAVQKPARMHDRMWATLLKSFNTEQLRFMRLTCDVSARASDAEAPPISLLQGPPGSF